MANDKPRIVIYGTGRYNLQVARFAFQKGWPIVAAYNRAGDKVGQDLGKLAGLEVDLGVIVQDCDTANYDGLNADVAFIATTDRLRDNWTANERMISRGINVISHASEGYFPWGMVPDEADRLDTLAKTHGVTFTGTGIWDYSRVWAGILATGPCVEIKSLFHKSITGLAHSSVPIMVDAIGVSLTQEEFHRRNVAQPGLVGGMYNSNLQHVLTAQGYSVSKVEEWREPCLSDRPMYVHQLDRTLEPGLVTGCRIIARVETVEGVTATAHIDLRLLHEGEVEHMLWEVEGLPSNRVITERRDNLAASAACMFNRARDVIAAPPGIQEIYKLGPLKTTAREQR